MILKRANSVKQFWDIARCPACHRKSLRVNSRIVRCVTCNSWYPIINGVIELVPVKSAYREDRKALWEEIGDRFGLKYDGKTVKISKPQSIQRQHFDSYANSSTQSYNLYESMTFWRVVDSVIFSTWMSLVPKKAVIIDVGCAQGRSALPFVENKYTVIGFDIAKRMIEVGNERFKSVVKPPVLFVGDATNIPVTDFSADVVVLYGVLHHLPDLKRTAKEIARVLKPNGILLSLENNRTPLRFIFDLLQKISCLWDEEAGESPTMSGDEVKKWFSAAGINVITRSHVFLPPHLLNLLPYPVSLGLLRFTDQIAHTIPFVRSWGGLIEIIGRKKP